jgi:hypothetical protein
MTYSMTGKTMASGWQPVLEVGDAEVERLILATTTGQEILAVNRNVTGVGAVEGHQLMTVAPNPFADELRVSYQTASAEAVSVEVALRDLNGRTVVRTAVPQQGFGRHTATLATASLQPGFYLLTLTVDGVVMQTEKVIKQ